MNCSLNFNGKEGGYQRQPDQDKFIDFSHRELPTLHSLMKISTDLNPLFFILSKSLIKKS